jgi:glycosyltransferase involved in cell wall biosynthesis
MIQRDAIVSVVAYLCDDAGILADFVGSTVGVLSRSFASFELVLVDDHSSDETPRIVEALLASHPGVRFIRLARHSGEEIAATAGLEAAVGDYVVVMRARFDPPEELPVMVRLASEHGGSVLGITTDAPRRGLLFRTLRGMFYRAVNVMLRAQMPADSTGFCALTRAAVNTISRTRSKRRHLRMLACTIGYPVTCHRYQPRPGVAQRDPRSLRDAVKEATSLLVANSKTPLRLVSSLGILAGSCNLVYVLYVIGVYLFKKEVAPGWATLSLQIAAMFFFVFLILTSLAEYVAQILEESQDNPLYHVEADRTSVIPAGTGARNVLTESTLGRQDRRRNDEAA